MFQTEKNSSYLSVLQTLYNDLTGNPDHGANDCGYVNYYYEWGDSECYYDGEPYICEQIGELEQCWSVGLLVQEGHSSDQIVLHFNGLFLEN